VTRGFPCASFSPREVTVGTTSRLVEAEHADEAAYVMLEALRREHTVRLDRDEAVVRLATFSDLAAFGRRRTSSPRPGDEPGLFDVSEIPVGEQ
jgi:hypothetical protein